MTADFLRRRGILIVDNLAQLPAETDATIAFDRVMAVGMVRSHQEDLRTRRLNHESDVAELRAHLARAETVLAQQKTLLRKQSGRRKPGSGKKGGGAA